MRKVSRLVVGLAALVGAGALAIPSSAATPAPSAPVGRSSSSVVSSGPVHFVHPAGAHAVGLFGNESTNWAGQVDQGAFTQVSGQWNVPAVQTSPPQYAASWVGIDGVYNQTLIQTGTVQTTGPTEYQAWYEIVPAAPVYFPDPVAPGDHMAANIVETSPGSDNWSITLTDTGRWTQTVTNVFYNGFDDSAEWIEEAPFVNNSIATLADFGSVTFTGMEANSVPPIDMFAVTMVNSAGTPIAVPTTYTVVADSFAINYVGPAPPVPADSGYDMVGRDGGVFIFPGSSNAFYGSLPGLHAHVSNIVGMVPTADDHGYFLVGSDGGVFAFGNAPFLGSLPALGANVGDVVGIVPTSTDDGYFLVGRDGGVFAFGNAPFLGSLPAEGVDVDDIIGIAADSTDQGYWLIASDGQVYNFGDAPNYGSAFGTTSPVAAIEATPDGNGYWIVTQNGNVYTFGDAINFGSLPALGVTPSKPIIGLVPDADEGGYWLIGADGGIFAFGDAPFVGSLPGLHAVVSDIVGAVPTTI